VENGLATFVVRRGERVVGVFVGAAGAGELGCEVFAVLRDRWAAMWERSTGPIFGGGGRVILLLLLPSRRCGC